jgi:hypothetical protein
MVTAPSRQVGSGWGLHQYHFELGRLFRLSVLTSAPCLSVSVKFCACIITALCPYIYVEILLN